MVHRLTPEKQTWLLICNIVNKYEDHFHHNCLYSEPRGKPITSITSPFSGCISAMISFTKSSRLPITHSLQNKNQATSSHMLQYVLGHVILFKWFYCVSVKYYIKQPFQIPTSQYKWVNTRKDFMHTPQKKEGISQRLFHNVKWQLKKANHPVPIKPKEVSAY